MPVIAERNEYLPLTPLQEGLLFETSLLDGAPDPYVLHLVAELGAELDAERLRAAADEMLRRHPNLRACFRRRAQGQAVQVVVPAAAMPWTDVDLSAHAPADVERLVEDATRHDREAPFDLREPPAMRATLLRRPDGTHRFLLAMHHIVIDGWSIPLLVEALADAYAGTVEGEVDVSFRSFLAWVGGCDAAVSDGAWSAALEGVGTPTVLAGTEDGVARRVVEHVDGAGLADLTAWARGQELTLGTVVQGAWAFVLAQATGLTDVVFGQVDSGRAVPVAGVERTVGLLATTFPVRVRVDPRAALGAALTTLQAEQTALLEHRHHGLARIQRLAGAQPLFDTILAVQNYPLPEGPAAARRLPVRSAQVHAATGYPVTVTVVPSPEGLELRLEHRGGVPDDVALGLLGRLAHLLRTLPGLSPDVLVAAVPVTTPDEAAAAARWAHGPQAWEGPLAAELLAQAADEHAEGTALVHGGATWTAAELHGRSRVLARVLAERGVGPGSIVAMSLPRTGDALVTILAVVAAGGAFTYLDPTLPPARLAELLADTRPVLVVGDAARLRALRAAGPLDATLDLADVDLADPHDPRRAPLPASARPAALRGQDPAYVIFTSGSTGRPKGVVVPHAALANLLVDYVHHVGLTPADRLLAVTTFGFDIAITELLAPLVAGSGVVLADEDTVRDVAQLAQAVTRHSVTVMQATPVHWRALVHEHGAVLRGVRVVTGGEALTSALADDLLGHGATVRNLYGPTETTVWSTGTVVAPDHRGEPLIGRPFRGTSHHVLDASLRPVAPGVVGELYIGGVQVALGYLDRPGLTAGRFVADPFGAPGARLYRSGDLVRWTPTGELECLGRVDHQVKVRGHRIELGEIESVLARHPAVVQSVVVARALPGSDERVLLAYVASEAAPTEAELLDHVRAAVPSFMVPARVVVEQSLPVTASGKVDRNRLVLPAVAHVPDEAPRTPLEAVLGELFAEVLGRAHVGLHESFFALGGHSLLATRLVARVRAIAGVDVPVRTLFDAPTVAGLAARLSDAPAAPRPGPSRSPSPRTEGPLSPSQERMWVLAQQDGTRGAYNVPLVVRLAGTLDTRALAAALRDVVARHEVLRTVYPVVGGRPVQRVLPASPAPVHLGVVDLAGDRDALDALLAALVTAPFDLTAAVPVRATCYRVDDDEHVLAVVVHHVATDGWSAAPLARDLSSAYAARRSGAAPDLPAPAVQYLDWAAWQAERLGDPLDPTSLRRRQLDHWVGVLADAPATLPLPTDRPRPATPTGAGERLPVTVAPAVHARLARLAADRGVTPFMVLHAALAATLTRSGAGTDVPIGTVVAGRSDEVLDDLVGFFVNTLVLRLDTGGDPTFDELLDRARTVAVDAHEHADVPFDAVVQAVNPPRGGGHNPLFQVMLVVQGAPTPLPDLAGVDVTEVALATTSAKVDLALELTEHRAADGTPAGVRGGLEVASELFDTASARRLADRFVRVLDAAVTAPSTRLSALPVLAPDEAARLRAWSGQAPAPSAPALLAGEAPGEPGATDRDATQAVATEPESGAAERTLADRLAAAAERRPDHPALVSGPPGQPRSTTFADLAAAAHRLGRELTDHGVGPGDTVAVVVGRSTEAVVAVLGVLAAGAAYLPVDPAHPADRVASTLADAEPALALVRTQDRAVLPAGTRTLVLDDPAVVDRLARRSATPLADADRTRPHGPDDAAYVVYTSGSTGRPKGVVVGQRSALALSRSLAALFGVDDTTRVLQFASLSFDASFWELATSVLAGATAVLVDDDARTGRALVDALHGHRVDVAVLPPVVLSSLPPGSRLPAGMQLCVAGEACPVETVARFCDHTVLRNLYGPTETTVHVTTSDPLTPASAPIGRPMPGHVVHVLDDRLVPVPVGVPGELYVGGDALALGYLGRAALTAGRFVADPTGAPGARMYRTGDVVRWSDDGQLHYVGRSDRQLKVDGHRIEPGEVESALLALDGVAQAVAHVRSLPRGGRQLVAHVVPTGSTTLDGTALRHALARAVPAAMVPASVTVVPEIPTTAHGKTDHARLPAAAPARDAPEHPADARTREVQAVFARVLGREVGADDDFFESGGNSIRSVELVSALDEAGVRVDVSHVLALRTPAALARATASDASSGTSSSASSGTGHPADPVAADPFAPVLRLRATGSAEPLFCVHGGLGLALPYASLVGHLGADRPVIGLQSPSVDPASPLPGSLRAVAAGYADLVEAYQPAGPVHLLGWSYGGHVAHELAVELQQRGREIAHLAVLDAFPWAPELDGPLPGDDVLLARFLEHLGAPPGPGGDDDPVTLDDVVARLARADSPVAGLDRARVARFVELMAQHGRAVVAHAPRVLDGDVDVYVATEPAAGAGPDDVGAGGSRVGGPGAGDPVAARADRWAHLVTGRVTPVPVAADHDHLLHPGPAAAVGTHLAARLAGSRNGAGTDAPPDDPGTVAGAGAGTGTGVGTSPARTPAPARRDLEPPAVRPGALRRLTTETAALVGRRFSHVRAAPGRLVGLVMNPLVIMIAVGYLFTDAIVLPAGTESYLDFLMAGVAIQVGLASIGPTAISVSSDVQRGLMDRFRSLPMSRSAVLLAHSLADLAIGAVALLAVLGTGLAIGWRPDAGIGGVLAGAGLVLAFVYVMVWVGIAIGLAMKQAESIDSVGALVLVVCSFLSSAILSPSAFPAWVRPVAEWNPVSAVATLCRELWGVPVEATGSFPSEHPWVVVALTFGVLLVGSAALSLRRYASRA